jgi:hypothetical protein
MFKNLKHNFIFHSVESFCQQLELELTLQIILIHLSKSAWVSALSAVFFCPFLSEKIALRIPETLQFFHSLILQTGYREQELATRTSMQVELSRGLFSRMLVQRQLECFPLTFKDNLSLISKTFNL